MARGGFEDVTQGRDEGVDAATEVLQIDEHHIERINHRVRWFAHLAIKTENGNTVHRIAVVRRLDHVVLFIAAQAVLWSEGGADLDVAARDKRIKRMRQILRYRSWMREQGHALAFERCAQCRFGDESIDTEVHGCTAGESS